MSCDKKILFMGTSDFSVVALDAICANVGNVEAVFTQMPKPAGRNYKLQKSLVHEYAEKHSIPVYTPKSLRNVEAVELLKEINPDVVVVAAYGLIIPQNILDIPKYGFINIHASILPRWRGASPIQAAINSGDTESGITIMKMDAGVDTGDIISIEKIDIAQKTTHKDLSDKLASLGAKMIVETLNNFEHTLSQAYAQPENGDTYAKKILKEDCKINWDRRAVDVLRQIMSLAPIPSAWTELDGSRIKIYDADIIDDHLDAGKIYDNCIIGCGVGALKLILVQPEGKNKMRASDFWRGHTDIIGKKFS